MSKTSETPPSPAPGLRVVLGSALFLTGQALATVFFAVLAILVAPCPYRWRYGTITTWNRFVLWWLGVCCDLHHLSLIHI